MTIKYKNYILRQEYDRFNLFRTMIVQEGENKGKEYEQEHGWSMKLDRAIEKMILLELERDDSTVDLQEFAKRYKAMKAEITKLTE